MRKYKDLTGQHFGRLTVIERVWSGRNYNWLCQCSCGNTTVTSAGNLTHGYTASCGCLSKERSRNQLYKHGDTNTRLWRIWSGMRRRCSEIQNKDYPNYGGRGISVCAAWEEYAVFRDWAYANGYNENLSIDRIDVNGDYTPCNCRWVDCKAQNNNRRNNHNITYYGETHTVAQWSEITNIPPKTIGCRLRAGWSVETALTTPVDHRNRLVKHISAQSTA